MNKYLVNKANKKIFNGAIPRYEIEKEICKDAIIYKYSDGSFKCNLKKRLSVICNLSFGNNLYRSVSSDIGELPIIPKKIESIQINIYNPSKVIISSNYTQNSEIELPKIILFCEENTIVNFTIDIVISGKL